MLEVARHVRRRRVGRSRVPARLTARRQPLVARALEVCVKGTDCARNVVVVFGSSLGGIAGASFAVCVPPCALLCAPQFHSLLPTASLFMVTSCFHLL